MLAGVLALARLPVANPFALLDFDAFRDGLSEQSAASSDGGGKLGLTGDSGILYYLGTTDLGARLAAGAGRARRRGGAGRARLARARSCSCRALVVFLLFMGTQDRFFARWLLPVYPLLCLLAAYGAVALATGRSSASAARARRGPRPLAGVLLCAQGLVFAIHNDVVLARADTRQLARDWMVENVPAGTKVVIEPVVPDSWASDTGPRARAPPATARAGASGRPRARACNADGTPRKGGLGPIVKLEDYERTLFPGLVRQYAAPRLLHRADRLDPVRPRARRARGGPAGDALLRRAARAAAASSSPRASPCGRSRSTSRSTPTRSRSSARAPRS